MKKIFFIFLIFLVVIIGLVYLSVSETGETFKTAEVLNIDDVENTDFSQFDSVLVATSTLYEASELKKLIQGENFREAWTVPVKVPVVYLDTLLGGMEIVQKGGGTQTQSLRLKSPDGVLYSLRSVNKNPASQVPEFVRTLGLENVVIDGISASHPFAAVLVASLAEAAGVLHTHPKPVFIPKQDFLGKYNEEFGNRLYLLEYETESEENFTSLKNVKNILDTKDLQKLKDEVGEKLSIDEAAMVRTRLFDLLIGDWDRHAKQYGWVVQETQQERYKAIPLPGDRDNAFFTIDGIIPEIVTRPSIEPMVRPFEEEIDYMPGLVYPNDIYFLYFTPEEIFIQEARNLQKLLTDEKIDEAFKVWPREFTNLHGKEIAAKIKSRRENLVEYAREFKKEISKRELLNEPLKNSEDINISPELIKCFECKHINTQK